MKRHFASAESPAQQHRRRQNQFTMTIISLMTLILLLMAGVRWYIDQGWTLRATPTLTATPRQITLTPTVDFLATRIAEDLALQRQYQMVAIGLNTPTPEPTLTPTITPTETPTLPIPPTETPAGEMTVEISLPSVVGGGPTQPESDIISTPTQIGSTVSPIQTPSPLETPTPLPGMTATVEPSATPTLTWTPVIAQQEVLLQAFALRSAPVRLGPSSLYSQTATLADQQRVILRGRDVSGEWVYLCCEQNIDGWTLQANVQLRDNQLPPSAPSNGTPNDARWLLERQSTAISATPIPARTSIPPNDFPLYRRNPAGQAQVNLTFAGTLQRAWPQPVQVGRSFSSPVIVVGSNVIVASEDLHLYSFDKASGSQRWRREFSQVIRHAVAVQEPFIYVVDSDGNLLNLIDQGNAFSLAWQVRLPAAPRSAPNLSGNLLFIAGVDNRLYAINRTDGSIVWSIQTAGGNLQYPIVGNQLLYVGNNSLQAVDIYNNGAEVWAKNYPGISAPPVYSQPGVLALAEVYAADNNGNLYALDANTGRDVWSYTSGERADILALDRSNLYAAGNGFIKAIARNNGALLWRYPLGERIVGGPIVGDGRLFFVTESGTVQILDSFQGVLIAGSNIASRTAGQPAASENYIFVPGSDGVLYALRESN